MHWFISILILSLGFYRLFIYHKKVKNYNKIPATIIGNDVKTIDDPLMGPKYSYKAIVEFTDNYGIKKQMIFSEENPDRPLYKDGTTITLLVDPTNSDRFLEYDFVNGYLIPIIWIVIGISVVAVPYLFPNEFR